MKTALMGRMITVTRVLAAGFVVLVAAGTVLLGLAGDHATAWELGLLLAGYASGAAALALWLLHRDGNGGQP